jgi:hypothetical protein
LSIAKRDGYQGHLWIWKDGLGGFRATDRVRQDGERLCQLLTVEEIEAHDDWQPMMASDVAPEDRPVRSRHRAG